MELFTKNDTLFFHKPYEVYSQFSTFQASVEVLKKYFFEQQISDASSIVYSRIKDSDYVICTFEQGEKKIRFFRVDKTALKSQVVGENLRYALLPEASCSCSYLALEFPESDEEDSGSQQSVSLSLLRKSCMTPFYVISNGGQYIMLFKFMFAMQKYYYAFNADSKTLTYLGINQITRSGM